MDTPWPEITEANRKFGQRMANQTECLDMNAELWRFRHDYTTQPATMAVFAVLYTVIICAAVLGNVCVVLAIARNKTLQTVPNLFILSLSISDIVVSCISATITPITAFKKEWLFGASLCSLAPWIAGISLCFSTFTLTAISMDRYMLIRFPMKKSVTRTQALFVIFGICLMSAIISAPMMFKQKLAPFDAFCGEYCTEDWGPDQNGRRVYGAVMLGVQFVLPLTIIILSYTAISLRIGQSLILKGTSKQKNPTEYEWQASLTDQQRAAMKRRQRTNRMLIAMVVAFSASWCWSVAFNVLRDYDYLPEMVKEQEYLFGIATHCIAMTSTVWNPLLYAMLNLQLREAFVQLLPEWLREWLAGRGDDTHSPLMHTPATAHARNKYASCETRQVAPAATPNPQNLSVELSVRAAVGGEPLSVERSHSSASIASRQSRSSSRKRSQARRLSAIQTFARKLSRGDEQEDQYQLLTSDSDESDRTAVAEGGVRVSVRRDSDGHATVTRSDST